MKYTILFQDCKVRLIKQPTNFWRFCQSSYVCYVLQVFTYFQRDMFVQLNVYLEQQHKTSTENRSNNWFE